MEYTLKSICNYNSSHIFHIWMDDRSRCRLSKEAIYYFFDFISTWSYLPGIVCLKTPKITIETNFSRYSLRFHFHQLPFVLWATGLCIEWLLRTDLSSPPMAYLRKVWKSGQVIETDTGGRYTGGECAIWNICRNNRKPIREISF